MLKAKRKLYFNQGNIVDKESIYQEWFNKEYIAGISFIGYFVL